MCGWLSLLMNVTWLPRATTMFLGETVLPAMVIVFVATAPDGGEVGLLAALEGVELFDPQAATQQASAAHAKTAPRRAGLFMSSLDRKTASK